MAKVIWDQRPQDLVNANSLYLSVSQSRLRREPKYIQGPL